MDRGEFSPMLEMASGKPRLRGFLMMVQCDRMRSWISSGSEVNGNGDSAVGRRPGPCGTATDVAGCPCVD